MVKQADTKITPPQTIPPWFSTIDGCDTVLSLGSIASSENGAVRRTIG
jgi:hypothetical protein